jgi:transcriptional regulator with XRE-family HTH domain
MKDLDYNDTNALEMKMNERVGRKRKDAPMTHLKYLRKRNGYTLETLSEITSISISYLSRLESGSRRLNTDLIRRLSHAFGCEPAELLQEVSHESRLVTPVEFSRKRKNDLIRESGIPLYGVAQDSSDPTKLVIKVCSPTEWKQRPSELAARNEVFAIKADVYFVPHFSPSSTLYLESSSNLAPESTVVILNCGKIMIKKIWSVTPTSLQVCDFGDIDLLKVNKLSKDKLVEIDRSSLDVVYKVVGYSDFDLK